MIFFGFFSKWVKKIGFAKVKNLKQKNVETDARTPFLYSFVCSLRKKTEREERRERMDKIDERKRKKQRGERKTKRDKDLY